MIPRTSAASTSREKPGVVLFRSRIEIAMILKALASEATTLWTHTDDTENLFITRLLRVDAENGYIAIAYSSERSANHELLRMPSFTLHAAWRGAFLEFPAFSPSEIAMGDTNAIRVSYPAALLRSHSRSYSRLRVPASVPLRCVADNGGYAPFEAQIQDIGWGGLGSLVCDMGIHLERHAVLRGCKIIHPNGDAYVVDLEVRHAASVVGADGEYTQRIGFRLLKKPKGFEKLLELFVSQLS